MIDLIVKYIMVLFFGAVMTAKEAFVFADRGVAYDSAHLKYLFLIYLFLGCWTLLLNNKRQLRALIIQDIIISIVLLADMVYMRYYSQYLTVQLIPLLKNNSTNLSDSILSLINARDLLLFVTIPIEIGVLFLVKKYKLNKNRFKLAHLAALVVIGFVAITPVKRLTVTRQDLLEHTWDMKSIADTFGLPFYHYHDIAVAVEDLWNKNNLSDENLQYMEQYFEDVQQQEDEGSTEDVFVNNSGQSEQGSIGNLTGIADGRNVIYVQCEALQNFVVNLKVNGKEVMPNLNKLAQDGLYFSSVYMQTAGGNTSDAEFMANNSLYVAPTGSVYFSNPNNNYNSMSKVLGNLGYSSVAMHGGTNTYWNRETAYNSFGFDKFYYNAFYSTDKTVGWGINDIDFFKESVAYLKELPQPFYSMMVTVSSHYPFGAFNHENRVDTGAYEDTQVNSYLEDMAYLDIAIGTLVDELKAANLYDNSVIVFYGDHRGLRDDVNEELTSFLSMENNSVSVIGDLTKIPLIVAVPGAEVNKEVTIPGGQVDIMPTVLNLLGVENKYMMGKDLLNTNDDMAILRNGSFITTDYIYSSDEEKAFDRASGEEVPVSTVQELIDKANRSLQVSDMILKYDALPKLGQQ